METINGIFIAFFLLSAMIAVPHWLMIKGELKSHGITTTFMFLQFSDIVKFKTLIYKEKNTEKLNEYKSKYYLTIIPSIICIFCFIGLIVVSLCR